MNCEHTSRSFPPFFTNLASAEAHKTVRPIKTVRAEGYIAMTDTSFYRGTIPPCRRAYPGRRVESKRAQWEVGVFYVSMGRVSVFPDVKTIKLKAQRENPSGDFPCG